MFAIGACRSFQYGQLEKIAHRKRGRFLVVKAPPLDSVIDGACALQGPERSVAADFQEF